MHQIYIHIGTKYSKLNSYSLVLMACSNECKAKQTSSKHMEHVISASELANICSGRLTFIVKDHEAAVSLVNINGETTAAGLCNDKKRFRVFCNGVIDDWNVCSHRCSIFIEGEDDGVRYKVFTTCER